MNIYEKIFVRLEEIHLSQIELSRRTGIATSTISDWKKKQINPQADKLVSICKALDISLTDLLCDDEDIKQTESMDSMVGEDIFLELFRKCELNSKKRILKYLELNEICKEINEGNNEKNLKRNVSIVQDIDGNNIVMINDIRFKGKRLVKWKEVREYLKEFVGDFYSIAATGDDIFIGSDLPREYSGSKYTKNIKGANAKAASGIPELIEISVGKNFRQNQEEKHKRNAKNGWYRYDSRFALPVYDAEGELERYNVFHASMIIRHSNDGKMYLYDIIDIKKETSNSLSE